jgi:hypothetical protein
MKQSTVRWTFLALLASAGLYLGTRAGIAQQQVPPETTTAQKLDLVLQKLDDVSKKLDAVSARLKTVGDDVRFVKERGY